MNKQRSEARVELTPLLPSLPSAGYETVCGHDKLLAHATYPELCPQPTALFLKGEKDNIIIYIYDKAKLFLQG